MNRSNRIARKKNVTCAMILLGYQNRREFFLDKGFGKYNRFHSYGRNIENLFRFEMIIVSAMELTDTKELYDKLREVYVRAWGTRGKQILESKIETYLKNGLPREEAILQVAKDEGYLEETERKQLEEIITKRRGKNIEETTKKQIDEYERTIDRLTILFSKGEISEESFKRSIKTIEKDLDKLRKGIQTPLSRSSYAAQVKKPTNWWYLVPLLFGLVGGLIGYVAVRNEDRKMAESLLVVGVFMSFVSICVFAAIFSYYVSTLSRF